MIKDKKEQWKTYRDIKKELWIWSLATISKRVNSYTIESKSSSPIVPDRIYGFTELYMLWAVRKYQGFSWDDCVDELKSEHNIDIKRWSVFYYLRHRWLTKKEKPKRSKFKEYEPWYLHIDLSYWPTIDGKKCYIYVAIDRATRLMYIEIHENKTSKTASKFLRNVIDFFPFKIEKILTDNWKEFTLKNHLWKFDLEGLFDQFCKEFDIIHRLTQPYSPRTNWMVEKANDTIKSNTVWIFNYEARKSMEKHILEFMLYYNLYRRHWWVVKEGKWRTPFDAYHHYYNLKPKLFKQSPKEFKNKLYQFAKNNNLQIYQKRNK